MVKEPDLRDRPAIDAEAEAEKAGPGRAEPARTGKPATRRRPAAARAPEPPPPPAPPKTIRRPGARKPSDAAEAPPGEAAPVEAPAVAAAPPAEAPVLPGLGRAVVALPPDNVPPPRRAPGEAAPPAPAERRRPEREGRPVSGEAERGRGRRRREERVEMPGERVRRPRKRKPAGPLERKLPTKAAKLRVRIPGEVTVSGLAHELGVKGAEVVQALVRMGRPATVNELLDVDTAALVAQEFGHEVVNVAFDEAEHLPAVDEAARAALPHRPPVVTVMGHVDHGKTTLLDTIRASRVAAGEAGGITQHVGAYQVRRDGRVVTFIDTPGHAAFSAMRARGARATDIVVLVVAADDGVMPQTVEAIDHAKAAGAPIVVAVNKMDKPAADPERVLQQLMRHGVVPERYGGDTLVVPVSALAGTGIDELLDSILLVAEVADLRANPDRNAEGVVLESRMDVGRGPVATLLVQTGTLSRGDTVVIGDTWGRVRTMTDEDGAPIRSAGPSAPAAISGLDALPAAGDSFVVVRSEKDARALVSHRQERTRARALAPRARLTVEDLYKTGGVAVPVVYLVVKADASGSVEALRSALEALAVTGARLEVLHAAVGPVNESDVDLAAADDAMVVAFGVKVDPKARRVADRQGVEIQRHDVIYGVLDAVRARMEGMLEPVFREERIGEAEVRALFKVPKLGLVAGCMVLDGRMVRGAAATVTRDGAEIHRGRIVSLRRFKEDVREAEAGFECGVGVEGATDLHEGDRIAVFTRVEVPRT